MALKTRVCVIILAFASLCVSTGRSQIMFNPTMYFPEVIEEQPVGTEVVTINSLYLNSFGLIRTDGTFSLPATGDAQYFTIETVSSVTQSSGIIRTAAVFDYDAPGSQTMFSFEVIYTTPDSTSATASVTVFLQDANDNAPQFTQSVFNVLLFEQTAAGTPFFNVTAVDIDLVIFTEIIVEISEGLQDRVGTYTVENGRILFSILEGNELRHFTINEENGTLSISPGVTLDIDLIDSYNLTVQAMDGGGLFDIATVLIAVLDSNDNQPTILSPRAVNFTLPEDTPIGYVVLDAINATDSDIGINGEIRFLIVDGDVTNSFTIDETSGEIYISALLDREVSEVIELTVAARDQGDPYLQDTIPVVINLLDVNDFVPRFLQDFYEVTVNEESRIETSVTQIVAIDLDEGVNGTVTYRILSGAEGNFIIDPLTGEIFTNGTLDHETVTSYTLAIEAVDNPTNISYQLTSEVLVTILIGDLNDNSPIFEQESYNVSILDNLRRGDEVIQLQASDRDSGSNGQISYRIEVADPNNSDSFAINPETGSVFVNRRRTFEQQSEYIYTIRALDNGSFRLIADVTLQIFIHNVNENPPVFEQEEYNETLIETTSIGTVALTVRASDPDVGLIGEVRYRIVSEFDQAGSFGVNESTGEICVNSRLDFDHRDEVFFQVEAYDGGFPEPFTDRANVTIFLTGTNDEAPSIIFPDGFQVLVPENVDPILEVINLSEYTFDPDFGMGGQFMFALSRIYDELSENDSFALNETTGLITSLRVFDREAQPEGIVVAIETIDFGTDPQSQITNVTIMIGDMNDNSPYFTSNVSAVAYEFTAPGQLVLPEYRAVDDDIGTNAELEYGIYAGDDFGEFSIDSENSTIFTAAILNKTVRQFYNLTIIVLDRGSPQLFAFGAVYIEVVDANDQPPIFSEDVYATSFPEITAVGTFLLQVNASDADIGTNAVLEYFFAPNSTNSERFTINNTTGEIFTNDIFDRENESLIDLLVIAVDDGLVPLTATVAVMVTVLDSNDNPPVFNESSYEAVVVENSANGTFVVAVFATDFDAEAPNNAVTYSLSGNGSEDFQIDPFSGEIAINGEVSWEDAANFTILAIATDSGVPELLDEVEITVFVEDINDEAPMFVPETLNLSIAENLAPEIEVGFVVAIDPDSPGNNSFVRYSTLMDFTDGRFQLDSETGLVTFVRGSLNRERRPCHELLIRAFDHGVPQLHTDATLIIEVIDANDFDPVFDQDLYFGTIPELVPFGSSVLTVHATDMDSGTNAELNYNIPDPTLASYFTINATTGVIYTNRDFFDFETRTIFSLQVVVFDLSNEPRFDSTNVTIEITDSNDHSPVFSQALYSVTLRENLASGTTVLRVVATDEDINENAAIQFSLRQSTLSEYFGIDPETGVLYTNRYINREETPYFSLTVIATNSEALPNPLLNETTVEISVTITDLNDMHPSFELVTKVFVPENTPPSTIIHTLRAMDGDEGLNGTVTFTLLQGNEDGLFQLNGQTGDLSILSSIDFETEQPFSMLAVMATDNGTTPLSNYTNVLVHFVDVNDNRPVPASLVYSVSVSSEADIGTRVATFQVFDTDKEANAGLSYTILAGNSQDLFEFQSVDLPILQTAVSLSSLAGEVRNLTLQVSDGVFDTLFSIEVFIQGGGTMNLPFFTDRAYEATISENTTPGVTVFEFSSEVTNAVNFSIVSGDVDNPRSFSINSAGTLVYNGTVALDFESRSAIQLSVSASNLAGDRTFAILTIFITDENEFPPFFILSSFFVAIPETIAIGETFFTAIATDQDGSSPANEIAYSIVSANISVTSTFRINSQTGDISLRRGLNFELGDESFTFNISATSVGVMIPPRYSSEVTIEIDVLNGNSYDPVFDQGVYFATLFEDAAVGLNIVNVSAFDLDLGSSGDITFGMHGDHRYLDFRIDTFSGEIYTNAPLDYERNTLYVLEVIASDGGNPTRTAVASVRVDIRDINDNIPVWEQDEYFVNVVEDAAVGSTIIEVFASDLDQVDVVIDIDTGEMIFFNRNGYVTYTISAGDPDGDFFLDPDTGAVTISSPLDREQYPSYTLTLNATDGEGDYTNAFLFITVHDVNDQIPVFTENPYIVPLPENSPNGTLIVQVLATDTDLNENSIIVYQLAEAFQDIFFLNATTGELYLLAAIDREVMSSYVVPVFAIDMGVPILNGTADVVVNIQDINEFPPVFSQDLYVGEVFENEPLDTFILQLNASDMDFGENATVLFAIVSRNDLNLFNVVATTGEIVVANPIDFELGDKYDLVVMATDSAPIERLSTEANVTIFILDRNDNTPIFEQTTYTAFIPENSIPGDLVLTVNATDADSGTNAQLVYSLNFLGDLEAEDSFIIDATTGEIYVSNTSLLDREASPSYMLRINVTDSGDGPNSNSVPLLIIITDVNDNAPQFPEPFFEGALQENLPPGTPVAMVNATDEDEGVNAEIVFEISRVVQDEVDCISTCGNHLPCQTFFDNFNNPSPPTIPPFSINPESGSIFSNESFNRESISSYVLFITVTDSSVNETRLSNTTCVFANVLDQNDETPRFNQTAYEAAISEYTQSMTLVTQVFATDDDVSTNADITFQLATETASFTIHPDTGVIVTLVEFDREVVDFYNVTVLAIDGGSIRLTGTTFVLVTISDENDNPPEFSSDSIFVSLEENLEPGSTVLQLNTSDRDIGINAVLSYSIIFSSPADHFTINATTGLLQTSQLLDREAIDTYLITVVASDSGLPSLASATQVNITVLDTNDLQPEFSEDSYMAMIEENFTPSNAILSIMATDNDLGSNAEVFFALEQVSPNSSAFQLNATTGDLFLLSPLNAESSLLYSLVIVASNGPASPLQSTEVPVVIQVVDLNDNAPFFEQSEYILPLLESTPANSEVITLTAFDLDATDENSNLTYVIAAVSTNSSLFSVDATLGAVRVTQQLDRESNPVHILEVTVFDNGSPPLNDTTVVTIILQDANDNVPVFSQSSYAFILEENAQLHTVVGSILASDADLQEISYYVLENITDGGFFDINSTTGEIFTAASLDREFQEEYTFIAVATDGGIPIELTAEVVVNVTLTDQNDVAPSFLNETYSVSWLENITLGTVLLQVEAFDLDLDESGDFLYSIPSFADSSFFSINATSGDIRLERELDRETQDFFQFIIAAQDLGDPSLTGLTSVTLYVLDNNDNVPIFNATEYQAVLLENTEVGSIIAYIGATDRDIDENGEVSFSLSEDFDGTFGIDAVSGILSLTNSLDYELTQFYSFLVIVQDNGVPALYNTSGVVIEVVDLNDNAPVLDSNVYRVSIPENAILQTSVFQIPATDADATSNGELRYTILNGNVGSKLSVNEITGLISVGNYLDREIVPFYLLDLRVIDQGIPRLSATTMLEITVLDINDHIPEFSSIMYSISLPETASIGTEIFTLTAADLDEGTNAEVTYSIASGNAEGKFTIDPVFGVISVNQSLDYELTPSFSLSVSASDGGYPVSFTTTTTLRIILTDANEHAPSFAQSTYLVNISDNTAIGTAVGYFIATDNDRSTGTQVRYTILENDVPFAVDRIEGTLHVSDLLFPGEFQLTLAADDGVFVTQVDVVVTVFPFENATAFQLFDPPAFRFEISESADINSIIGELGVADVTLNIQQDLFEIDSDGRIILIGQLDREMTAAYVFNVMASGDATYALFVVVTIIVIDYNDFPPVFESSQYSISISELIPIGTTILTLRAFDRDAPGINSEFEASVTEGNEGGSFNFEPSTGELSVGGPLDFEQQSVHVLTANVTNSFASPELYSTAEIVVSLRDENDNNPMFSQMFYLVQIPESTAFGTEILELDAIDLDSGSNSELVFSITHLNVPNSFIINQTSGAIATNTTFQFGEDITSSYIISAAVTDRGNPRPRSDTTTIFVEVTPDNVYPPQFDPPQGYNIEIPETLAVGGSVIQISAVDPDTGLPPTFAITSGDTFTKFDIDPSTGLVTLISPLDVLQASSYELVIEAVDSGTPPILATVGVNIAVIDINNHLPEFQNTPYIVEVIENVPIGSSVITIIATDPDAIDITYALTINSYQDGIPLFFLDNQTGIIYTAGNIDREFAGVLEVLVTAIDSGYPLQLSNSITVTILVQDLNDNPPGFNQSQFTIPALRLLTPGQFVSTVTATDADLVGQGLEYNITADTSVGVFAINPSTGDIVSTLQVPEEVDSFELTVTAFDGVFVTDVAVRIQLVNNGDFCEENGYCTVVREVNCTFDIFPFVDCNPFCTGDFGLSPAGRVCVRHYCLEPALVPCTTIGACIPPNMACAGICPDGMSVCPTTNVCHVTSLSESCDGSNETCLIGQTFVQRMDGSRYCTSSELLPPTGQTCTENQFVYCESLDQCANISTPLLCQACPTDLSLCVDTGECVPDLIQCCGFNDSFCDVLNSCITQGERCELPNVAPTISVNLIYLESITSSDNYASEGHVIALLLGNGSQPAVDSQGEEVTMAIVGVSQVPESLGEWQYTLCENFTSAFLCSDASNAWIQIEPSISEANALVLPNTARVRFIRKAVEFDGAVWLMVKLWDGNTDGYLSTRSDIVRSHDPSFDSTLPFTPTGGFSADIILVTVLAFPLIQPPSLSAVRDSNLQLSNIQEDVVFAENFGNQVSDFAIVDVPNFQVLPEDMIFGFPAVLPQSVMVTSYEQLLPSSVLEDYYSNVQLVNPTRRERALAAELNQNPGIALSIVSEGLLQGNWQVSLTNDPRLFVPLNSVIQNEEDVLLLNTSARLRFLPSQDFCGEAAIYVSGWDGFWNESLAAMRDDGFIVTTDGSLSLSPYHLNERQLANIDVECIPDNPVVLENRVFLDPIPHHITYSYERLFTALVARETASLRDEEERLEDFLQLILQLPVDIERLWPSPQDDRTFVSFSVEDDLLSFEAVSQLILERQDTLAELELALLNLTKDASYGPGSGCLGNTSPQQYHGVHINSFISQFASDSDTDDFIGIAVIAANVPEEKGVWQYYRGVRNSSDLSSEYDPTSNIWVNFPPFLSETRALLLHGNDRIRFIPKPDYYWSNSTDSSLLPVLQVKVWDNSVGGFDVPPSGEISSLNVNTSPFEDTQQSLYYPRGRFSSDVMTIVASRFGCDGVINSALMFDACCVCGGSGEGCEGCDGVTGGNALYDACNECNGLNTQCLGCDFIPFSDTEPGLCTECISNVTIPTGSNTTEYTYPPSSFTDCNLDCHGTAILDGCSICSAGQTSHSFNADIDCSGSCFGTAEMDTCGDCTGPNTDLFFNANIDCTGVCHGSFVSDSCGVCQLQDPAGGFTENRDCDGVCFGDASVDACGVCFNGTTNLTADSSLDVCGVCDGDGSSCVGCDGVANSGSFIDSCGNCGGNNCNCFQVDSIFPNRGPRTGGTAVVISGAGFFLNDTSLLNFTFDSQVENCGAPYRYPITLASIPITCIFIAPENQQLQAFAIPVNQSTIRCITEATTQFETHIPEFSVQIRVADGPFSNSVTFYYDDYSTVNIEGPFPSDTEIDRRQTITFIGNNFINTPVAACFVYGLEQCFINTTTDSPFIIPSNFVSSSEVSCELPKAEIPCRVTVRFSVDGQDSGLLTSPLTDFQFTYHFSSPIVEDVYFLSDLSNLIIEFDRPVQLLDNLQLSCENVFSEETLVLIGGTEAQCYWSDSTQQAISIALPTIAIVQIGSPIRLRNGVIVTRGEVFSYAIEDVIVDVNSERNVLQPIAILSGPNSIPACNQVSFSGIHSLYPGYRGFEYTWSIVVEDSVIENYTVIINYLNNLSRDANVLTLDANWFLIDVEYYLQLSVVNSVGLQSETESILLTKEMSLPLQVFIDGSVYMELYSGEDLTVQSRLTAPECSQLIGPFEFRWQLSRVVDQRRGIMVEVELSNVRTQSSEIIIPASYFTQDTEYQLQVTVTETSQELTTTALVDVSVQPVNIVARINGGNRTVSQARQIVLDARTSQTNPSLSAARYSWICSIIGSLNACYNQSALEVVPTPISITNSNFTTIPGRHLEAGLTYNFTLLLQQDTYITSTSVLISIVASQPPIVEIVALEEIVQSTKPLLLEGLVYSQFPIENAHWESVQMPGFEFLDLTDPFVVQSQTVYSAPGNITPNEYSGIPLVATVTTNESSRTNLVLHANTLMPGASYIFRLTASNMERTSSAEITITPNLPPHSAYLSITPSHGIALQTEFILAVVNAQDAASDTPFTYQFGIILQDGTNFDFDSQSNVVADEYIQWLTGIQATSQLQTILPSGAAGDNFSVPVFARIIDRQGGFSDVITEVTVLPNAAASNENYYGSVISEIQADFLRYKDWNTALARLVATLEELNKNSIFEQQNLKEQSLELLRDIFNNHLPPSSTHYILVASLLSEITANNGVPNPQHQTAITGILQVIVQWFQQETAIETSLVEIPTQSTGEPLFLRSVFSPAIRELTTLYAFEVLSPWMNILEVEGESLEDIAQTFVETVDSISQIFCQESATGEDASTLTTTLVNLYIKKAIPIGPFNVSNNLVDFGTSLLDPYRVQTCNSDNAPCAEACITSALYATDLFSDSSSNAIELSPETKEQLRFEIPGSDPEAVELITDVLSLSIPIPSSNSFLEVENLDNPFQIFIPMKQPTPDDASQPLCLSREVGSGKGFENTKWRIDSFESPRTTSIESTSYFTCEFNHLSEFAIGLLPPPIITQPPITTMATTPTTESETTPTTTTTASTMATTSEPTPAGMSVIGIAVAIIVIVIVIIVIVILLVVFFVWWKKRSQKLKISPVIEAEVNSEQPQEKAKLVKAGPLTPEESKIPMNIIHCLENGERTVVGKMGVLPSIRLRELRYQLGDKFETFKNKRFYFLTRQLCDIEPPEEQQRFVSLVYGDKAIFVREITVTNELTCKHFCFCGNAAQFECSNCSAQGYCSPECQLKHWADQHQKECGRLSEKKNRTDVLLRRQTTTGTTPLTSPMNESPRRITLATAPSAAKSPTSPMDWKGFLNNSKSFQQQQPQGRSLSVPPQSAPPQALLQSEEEKKTSSAFPISPRVSQTAPKVTLGQLAGQPSLSTNQELSETPVVPTTPLRPLIKLPSAGAYSLKRKQPPPIANRSISVQYPPGHYPQAGVLPPVSTQQPATSPYSLASPQRDAQDPFDNNSVATPTQTGVHQSPYDQRTPQAFFTRGSQPRSGLFSPRASINVPARQLSIQSVGSEDLAYSLLNMTRDVRNEPLLESDEDEYESSSTGSEGQTRTTTSMTQDTVRSESRPPSLAVRKKRSSATKVSRKSRPSPSPSSGSSSSESSKDGRSQTPSPALPRTSVGTEQSQTTTTTATESRAMPSQVETESQAVPDAQLEDSSNQVSTPPDTDSHQTQRETTYDETKSPQDQTIQPSTEHSPQSTDTTQATSQGVSSEQHTATATNSTQVEQNTELTNTGSDVISASQDVKEEEAQKEQLDVSQDDTA